MTAALDLGSDINAITSKGDTALHGAAAEGYNRVIQLLADREVLLCVKNKRGQTPLQVAMGGAARNRGVADVTADSPGLHQQSVDLLNKLGAE